ncbi:MAG: dienelactone hydrolase family protein [Pseudomonadota bacterium]|nr:dienelactone hydrolase family protein [Pseudomonadota bacterium]
MLAQDILIQYEKACIPAYFSEPQLEASVGVIVISAIFGVDDDTKRICDRLADMGFPAIALNMFWEDEIDSAPLSVIDHEKAKVRSTRVDRKDGNAYIKAAISWLKSNKSCNGKVVAFGFCYGGPYVIEAAARYAIDGGISFHGSYIEKFLPEFKNITCPLEFHYGDNDAVAPLAAIEEVKIECDKRENRELFIYPGGEHGYMFPNRGLGYHADAAELSWERAIKFLGKI